MHRCSGTKLSIAPFHSRFQKMLRNIKAIGGNAPALTVPSARHHNFQVCGMETQTRQSLWIYATVENMQTVCEGLHVTCTIASVDHVANLAALRLILTLRWTDAFPLGCVCFLKLILPMTNTLKCIKNHVYIIYINISIYCISFFCKSCFELQNVWMQCIMGYWARCKKIQWFVPTEIPLQEMK